MPEYPSQQLRTPYSRSSSSLQRQKILKRYNLNAQTKDDLSTIPTNGIYPLILSLNNQIKTLAIKTQKGTSVLNTASQALYYRSKLKELISSITSLINNLEKIFLASQTQLALIKQEKAEIHNLQALKLVQTAAKVVDDTLHAAIREALTGHQYLNVTINGKAQTVDASSVIGKVQQQGHAIYIMALRWIRMEKL